MDDNKVLREAINKVEDFAIFGECPSDLAEALEQVRFGIERFLHIGGYNYETKKKMELTDAKLEAFKEGQMSVERMLIKDNYLKLTDKTLSVKNVSEINIEGYGEDEVHFEPVRYGYWEAPDPDYDRDGERLPIKVAICSECQRPTRLPATRFCPNCGSWNKDNGRSDD